MAKPANGFVFAATGPGYTDLTRQAASSLRAVLPDAQIDLFTDQTVAADPFDRVERLGHSGRRPKFEALQRSRFERTIYLDADIIVLADISDVFDILGAFDIAAAHDQFLNNDHNAQIWRQPIPAAFPQLNSGVVASRRSPGTQALFKACIAALRADPNSIDQPIFRELLYQSDLRLAVLPPQFNLMNLHLIESFDETQMAPRVLHLPLLHRHLNKGLPRITTARQVVGPQLWAQIQRLLRADRAQGQTAKRDVVRLTDRGALGQLRRFWLNLSQDLARRRR